MTSSQRKVPLHSDWLILRKEAHIMSRKQKKIFSSVIVIVLIIAMVMGCIASFVFIHFLLNHFFNSYII